MVVGVRPAGVDDAVGRIVDALAGLWWSRPIAAMVPSVTRMSGPSARAAAPRKPVMIAAAPRISIRSRAELALVPVAEREPDSHTIARKSATPVTVMRKQRGEEPRDVELESRLEDLVGEARAVTAGAGDELRDYRADQREPAGDAQAAEEVRRGARDAQPHERLQRVALLIRNRSARPRVHAPQAERRVGDDREDRDDRRAQHQRDLRVLRPR